MTNSKRSAVLRETSNRLVLRSSINLRVCKMAFRRRCAIMAVDPFSSP